MKTAEEDTGSYYCWAPGCQASNTVQLTVSSDWLILQTPYHAVFEGDQLPLRCRGWTHSKLSEIRYYRDGRDITPPHANSELTIERAKTADSGTYCCKALMKPFLLKREETSRGVPVSVQELFSSPALSVTGSGDITEGSPVTLKCDTRLNPQKSGIWLQTFFYKDNKLLRESGSSITYHIPEAGLEDSGFYYCTVQTMTSSVEKRSLKSLQIAVKRIPVSGVSLEVQPLGGQVMEGEWLGLSCSVKRGTGPITFSWHRAGSRLVLRNETQCAQRLVHEIPMATEADTGEYYCQASNDKAPASSPAVKVDVRVPVSPPLLTLSTAGSGAAVGDMVEIRCQAPHGSAPILYRFHHEAAALGNRTVNSRGPGSLTLNVTSEQDSGTYFCEADNGLGEGARSSAPFLLSVLVPVSGTTITASPPGPEVMAGESLNLTCLVKSGTTPSFKWLHNAQELDAASGLSLPMAMGNMLHFGSVQLSHGGDYQCIASNQLSPQRVFQAQSEILAITVIEGARPWVAVAGTFSFLGLIGIMVALVFYFKFWKNADGWFFSAPRRDMQHKPPGQRPPPPDSRDLHAEEPSYTNVCPLRQQHGRDVVYAVVNIKKRSDATPEGTLPGDTGEYSVSYSVLSNHLPTGQPAAGARAPKEESSPTSDIYENVPHL
ncbi:Fc receptor-like protein 6 [Carettochelys insculpta]|uniref:Fc receptor-like protein 6 n=1 Tax=Carettochelys insculpta TaxID=44489 RepID=UPI003EBEEB94